MKDTAFFSILLLADALIPRLNRSVMDHISRQRFSWNLLRTEKHQRLLLEVNYHSITIKADLCAALGGGNTCKWQCKMSVNGTHPNNHNHIWRHPAIFYCLVHYFSMFISITVTSIYIIFGHSNYYNGQWVLLVLLCEFVNLWIILPQMNKIIQFVTLLAAYIVKCFVLMLWIELGKIC